MRLLVDPSLLLHNAGDYIPGIATQRLRKKLCTCVTLHKNKQTLKKERIKKLNLCHPSPLTKWADLNAMHFLSPGSDAVSKWDLKLLRSLPGEQRRIRGVQ